MRNGINRPVANKELKTMEVEIIKTSHRSQ
jgi:hypothetical protein